ncbi:MAG TPA: amino acid ABC transporter permease [Candidatus Fraserbacteria bacterium]|nr:amino acid ABC transporter permease [Candidatus Fraserbacteria bacterium]
MSRSATTIEIDRPPVIRSGPLRWLKENLFSTWYNTLLTVGSLAIALLLAVLFGHWALTEAHWAVIPANLKLLFVGTYPLDQLWRIWATLYMVALFLGFSGGLHRGLILQIALTVAAATVLLALLPFAWATRLWILATALSTLVGFGLGRLTRQSRTSRWLEISLWLLSFPLTLVLLKGGLFLPVVGEAHNVGGWNKWGFMLNLLGAVVGITLSLPIGILLALGRRSSLPAVRLVSTLYIELIRGVPLITLLFMASNMLPLLVPTTFRPDIVIRAMMTITAFSAAYMAENVRGGLQAIPQGQFEAAYAVGLGRMLTTLLIVLPQALRAVIPAIVGQLISLFKDTTLFGFIAILELLGMVDSVLGNLQWRGTIFELYIFIGFIFWIFCYSLSYISRRIEKNLGVGER